jgi:hypothetical protein
MSKEYGQSKDMQLPEEDEYRMQGTYNIHCKKELAVFPSPAGMSLIKLFLGGNNLVFSPPRESLVSDIPAGDGKMANSFLQCICSCNKSTLVQAGY